MRSRYFVALACALCTGSAFSCSDDGSEQMDTLPLQGGSSGASGASNGGSSNGGTANGGSANGGTSGSNQGGSGNPGSGGTGQGGAAGNGMAGTSMTEAGAGGDVPDAGGGDDGPPDSGSPDEPDDEAVSFSEVYPILVANCAPCHANANGLPGFARPVEADAYGETQDPGAQGQLVAQRIIARAVTARTMPPACGGTLGQGACLSVEEAALLQAWLDDGAEP